MRMLMMTAVLLSFCAATTFGQTSDPYSHAMPGGATLYQHGDTVRFSSARLSVETITHADTVLEFVVPSDAAPLPSSFGSEWLIHGDTAIQLGHVNKAGVVTDKTPRSVAIRKSAEAVLHYSREAALLRQLDDVAARRQRP